MAEVKGYIYSILVVSAAAGIINLFAPEGTGGGIKKYVKYIVSLAVVLTLLLPLGDLLRTLPKILNSITAERVAETEKYEPEVLERLAKDSAAAIGRAVEDALKRRFEIEEVEITLELDTSDYNSIVITKAYIAFYSQSESYYMEAAEKYVGELLDCEAKAEFTGEKY